VCLEVISEFFEDITNEGDWINKGGLTFELLGFKFPPLLVKSILRKRGFIFMKNKI
jgi:hypothetical protein